MQSTSISEKYLLFNTCPFLVIVINQKGEIVFENDFCKKLFVSLNVSNIQTLESKIKNHFVSLRAVDISKIQAYLANQILDPINKFKCKRNKNILENYRKYL